jgi:hypothetical protein
LRRHLEVICDNDSKGKDYPALPERDKKKDRTAELEIHKGKEVELGSDEFCQWLDGRYVGRDQTASDGGSQDSLITLGGWRKSILTGAAVERKTMGSLARVASSSGRDSSKELGSGSRTRKRASEQPATAIGMTRMFQLFDLSWHIIVKPNYSRSMTLDVGANKIRFF